MNAAVRSAKTVLGQNGSLLALMLGHFTNDLFGGVLPVLLPTAKERFALGNAEVGLIALAFTSGASLSQPFFGYLFDRYPRRWFPSISLLWGASFAAAWGFAGSFSIFLVLALLGGLASGAYHPFGASSAAAVTPEGRKNAELSIYTVGGTTGFALGPLVAALLLAVYGPRGTIVLIVPGMIMSFVIYQRMAGVLEARAAGVRARAAAAANAAGPVAWSVIARIVGVVMLRSWVLLSMLQFVPIWYADLGYGPKFYGPLVTTIILAGAVGTLLGGALADRIGARFVLIGSLWLSVPPLLLFAGFPGWWAFASGAMLGLIADSNLAVTLVAAQRLLPGRTGIASGVILGLGFITGGIGVPVTGLIADQWSIPIALAMTSSLVIAAGLLALTIPRWAFDASSPSEFVRPIGMRNDVQSIKPTGRDVAVGDR